AASPDRHGVDGVDGWDLLTPRDADRCDLALRVLDRGPFNGTCLRQSLLLAHLLRHRDPVLRVGVAKVDGAVRAHAWIEIDGASLDPTRSDFQVLVTPVPGGAA
ncbi:lasso peptide biosynthesis B2 protein, partial [Actinotalea sp. C106]|uniref:lasso peptide biosynthesis B2 protein n=1 Tax=Actinotalea sp. C106 TaxID=2908644 RepID=UPI0020285502